MAMVGPDNSSVHGEGVEQLRGPVPCIPGIPPDPLPLQISSQRVFVLSGPAQLRALHMTSQQLPELLPLKSECPPVCLPAA